MNKMLKFWISVFGVSDAGAPIEKPVESEARVKTLREEMSALQTQLAALQAEAPEDPGIAKIELRLRDIERLIRVYSSVTDF